MSEDTKVIETTSDSANTGKSVEKFARLINRAKLPGTSDSINPSVFIHQYADYIRDDVEFQTAKFEEFNVEIARLSDLIRDNNAKIIELAGMGKTDEISDIVRANDKLRIARNDETLRRDYVSANFVLAQFEVEKGERGRSLPQGCNEVESVRAYKFETPEHADAFIADLEKTGKRFETRELYVFVWPTKRQKLVGEISN